MSRYRMFEPQLEVLQGHKGLQVYSSGNAASSSADIILNSVVKLSLVFNQLFYGSSFNS